MNAIKPYTFWFATGSQDLYGDECLSTVAAHSAEMVERRIDRARKNAKGSKEMARKKKTRFPVHLSATGSSGYRAFPTY